MNLSKPPSIVLFFGCIIVAAICGCASAQSYGPPYVPYQPAYQSYPQYAPPAPPVTPAVLEAAPALTPDQISQLVAPIALYPDPLLAQIFPAATFPQDVAAAEQWLQETSSPTEDAIQAQSWDPSIKALTHYPTVLQMMAGDLNWTTALGVAFINQQQDVMDAVQRLRAQAQAVGNLQTNQQQQIVSDGGALQIEPADPNVICVPQYDPNLVYAQTCPIGFGNLLPIGIWLDNGFDWHNRWLNRGGGWYQGWKHPEDWDRHPPKWEQHYVATTPQRWERPTDRPAPRLTPEMVNRAVSHYKVPARPGAVIAPRPQPLPVGGREAVPAESRNVFGTYQKPEEVQRAVQQAGHAPPREAPRPVAPAPAPPRPAAPAPAPRAVERAPEPTRTAAPTPEPRPVTPAPRPPEPARPAAPSRPPEPPHAAPSPPPEPSRSFPSGDNGAAARAQSQRGNASAGGRH